MRTRDEDFGRGNQYDFLHQHGGAAKDEPPSRRFFDPFAAAGEAMPSHHHDLEETNDERSTCRSVFWIRCVHGTNTLLKTAVILTEFTLKSEKSKPSEPGSIEAAFG